MDVRLDESTLGILIDALCRISEVDYATVFVRYLSDDNFIVDPR